MSDHLEHRVHAALIVLAEDETLVRATALEALREAGFDVVEACHSDEAVAAIEADAEAVQALFTDVQMPGGSMDGLALAHHARKNWPWIAIVVASGNAGGSSAKLPAGSRFVSKPYALEEIVDHLLEMTAHHRH
jgi:CheY-like chemotaxis protein